MIALLANIGIWALIAATWCAFGFLAATAVGRWIRRGRETAEAQARGQL